MRHRAAQTLVISLAAAFAVSCVMITDTGQGQIWQPAQEFRKSVDFKAGGIVALEHTLGNVSISGWDKDAVEVTAKGSAPEPGTGRRLQLYSMDDLEPSIDVRQDTGVLRIRTRSLGGPWASGGLDYTIQVPSSVNLNSVRLEKGDVTITDVYGSLVADSTQGNLTVKNYSGSVEATLGSGDADVELLDIRSDDLVEITVKAGQITLRLEADANARIEGEAPKGTITSDYEMGGKLPAKTLDHKMGGGEARIILKALQGSIRILKTE